jgi:hypothetical protein
MEFLRRLRRMREYTEVVEVCAGAICVANAG